MRSFLSITLFLGAAFVRGEVGEGEVPTEAVGEIPAASVAEEMGCELCGPGVQNEECVGIMASALLSLDEKEAPPEESNAKSPLLNELTGMVNDAAMGDSSTEKLADCEGLQTSDCIMSVLATFVALPTAAKNTFIQTNCGRLQDFFVSSAKAQRAAESAAATSLFARTTDSVAGTFGTRGAPAIGLAAMVVGVVAAALLAARSGRNVAAAAASNDYTAIGDAPRKAPEPKIAVRDMA